jgi:hypothetical protein
MPGHIKTLPELIYKVLLDVQNFIEVACRLKEDRKDFETWGTQIREMRQSTENPNYVCEENLVLLMNLQIDFSNLWSNMLLSFRSGQIDNYNHLQMKMQNIISRMQLKILLQRMENL